MPTKEKKSRSPAAKKSKIKEIALPETPLWRYECSDGVISIYTPEPVDERITYERALWLLERARHDLMRQFHMEP